MSYTANITSARFKARALYLQQDAYPRLGSITGPVDFTYGHPKTVIATGKAEACNKGHQGLVYCSQLYTQLSAPSIPGLPLLLGAEVTYDVSPGVIHILTIKNSHAVTTTGSSPPQTTQSSGRTSAIQMARSPAGAKNDKKWSVDIFLPTKAKSCSSGCHSSNTPSPSLPSNPTDFDLIKALVDWIGADPHQRLQKHDQSIIPCPSLPVVTGWDKRLSQYGYSKGCRVAYPQVLTHTQPMRSGLQAIVRSYNWSIVAAPSSISSTHRNQLGQLTATVFDWGGIKLTRKTNNPSQAWMVIKSAVLGVQCNNAPMSSGWTKVASFATEALPNPQTIWDSRVSTSIICRIDQILHQNRLTALHFPCLQGLRLVSGRGGTRPRNLNFKWPHGSCTWPAHLAGSAIVREIVDILNDPKAGYPRMPQPNGQARDWDMFSVGLVLFMDGY